jgi:hypothetical protein
METAKAVPLSIICMAWESNMTRDQKEQYVLELYQQGRTIRHIAQLVHMSFTEIGRIIKRENGQMEEKGDDYDVKSKSKTAKAIKLFSEGKNLVDVVIALDLQPDEVRTIYQQIYSQLLLRFPVGCFYPFIFRLCICYHHILTRSDDKKGFDMDHVSNDLSNNISHLAQYTSTFIIKGRKRA